MTPGYNLGEGKGTSEVYGTTIGIQAILPSWAPGSIAASLVQHVASQFLLFVAAHARGASYELLLPKMSPVWGVGFLHYAVLYAL